MLHVMQTMRHWRHKWLYYTFLQVLRTALSNRLAKVQGFLFRAAFLRRVPLFFQLISENILLCFLLSTMHSTSKYITGTLSLRFRKILTRLIHTRYFEVRLLFLVVRILYLVLNSLFCLLSFYLHFRIWHITKYHM